MGKKRRRGEDAINNSKLDGREADTVIREKHRDSSPKAVATGRRMHRSPLSEQRVDTATSEKVPRKRNHDASPVKQRRRGNRSPSPDISLMVQRRSDRLRAEAKALRD